MRPKEQTVNKKKAKKLKKFAGKSSNKENEDEVCSVEKLLDKADDFMNTFDYERAKTCCQRTLHLDADNVRAVETLASIYLETGDVDEAKQLLDKAVVLAPESGYNKYMSLGQLREGKEAIQHYQKGIQLMRRELETLMQNSDLDGALSGSKRPSLVRDLSTAYCAITEIFLTDCCFEEDAEQRCAENISCALEVDPNNPEAYQTQASFLLIKDQMDEAKAAMEKSLSLWLPKFDAEDESTEEASVLDPGKICPLSYDTRINGAKILIELEEYFKADDVLEGLIDEDDEVVEVWYLKGWTNYLLGEDYKTNARWYFTRTKELAGKVGFDDTGILEHVNELLTEMGPGEDDKENSPEEGDDLVVESSGEEDESMQQ